MAEELQQALREVRDTLLDEPVSPRVETPVDINLHYCRYVAESVTDRLGNGQDIEILEDGGRGYMHTWLHHDGSHYDAECVEGVTDYRDLPFFQRHPEAAINIEPVTVGPATLRHRGKEPLYPGNLTFRSSGESNRMPRTNHWKYALVGLLLGGVLIVAGLGGEWALHRHFIRQSAHLRTLFIDLEIIGELIMLVSPIVFFVLLPAQRAEAFRIGWGDE